MLWWIWVAIAEATAPISDIPLLRICTDAAIKGPTYTTRLQVLRPSDVRRGVYEGLVPRDFLEATFFRSRGESIVRSIPEAHAWQPAPTTSELIQIGMIVDHPRSGARLYSNGSLGGGPFRPGPGLKEWTRSLEEIFTRQPPENRESMLDLLLTGLNDGTFDSTKLLRTRSLADRFATQVGKDMYVLNDLGEGTKVQITKVNRDSGTATLSVVPDSNVRTGLRQTFFETNKFTLTDLYERLSPITLRGESFSDLQAISAETRWMKTLRSDPTYEIAVVDTSISPARSDVMEAQSHGILSGHHVAEQNTNIQGRPLGMHSDSCPEGPCVRFFNARHLMQSSADGVLFAESHRFEGATPIERLYGYAHKRVILTRQGAQHFSDLMLTATGARILPVAVWQHIQQVSRYLVMKMKTSTSPEVHALLLAEGTRYASLVHEAMRTLTLRLFNASAKPTELQGVIRHISEYKLDGLLDAIDKTAPLRSQPPLQAYRLQPRPPVHERDPLFRTMGIKWDIPSDEDLSRWAKGLLAKYRI